MDWTHRIRLRNLHVLLSLAQTNNISRSALALHMTQPSLSKWLKELEEDVGLPLFERHARGLRPTVYGNALIAHARRIDGSLTSARDEMESMRDGGSGLVRIGAWGAATAYTVPQAMLNLQKGMPHVRMRLNESSIDRLMGMLADGDLDIVVGQADREGEIPGIHIEPLYTEPIQLVTRPGHPIHNVRKLTWAQLSGYPWLTWPKDTAIRNALDAALISAGHSLPPKYVESNSVLANLTLLNGSDMIGIASRGNAQRFGHIGLMSILPFDFPGVARITLYWRADSSGRAAVIAALDSLRCLAKNVSPSVAKRGKFNGR